MLSSLGTFPNQCSLMSIETEQESVPMEFEPWLPSVQMCTRFYKFEIYGFSPHVCMWSSQGCTCLNSEILFTLNAPLSCFSVIVADF